MTIGIMQPYFMPYIGYWQLLAAVDCYVVYDDVNYIKGGWVSRNNILLNGEKHTFTITLRGTSPNKLFNEITILDDFRKFFRTIENAYKKTPFYQSVLPLLQDITNYPDRTLGAFMLHSFQVVLDYLGIHTELLLSSSLQKDNTLRGKDKVMQICHLLGADTYYNAIGGQALYDKDEFLQNGLNLYFLQTADIVYPQFHNTFVSNLSFIDVLMFNSPEQINNLLKQYTLL